MKGYISGGKLTEKLQNEEARAEQDAAARFENPAPIDEQPRRVSKGLGLAILSSVAVLPLAFLLALKPTSARAVWEEFARMMELKGPAASAKTAGLAVKAGEISSLPPQAQAEMLLQQTVNNYDAAGERLATHVDGWRGQLTMSPRLASLLDSGLNASDLRVRAAAVEMELAVNDLPKTVQSAGRLRERIESDPKARPWALWMLGALGNRGIEPERALDTLVKYSRDGDEKTRFWAVEGLSLLGTDATIRPLLEVFRNDPAIEVRERAGCGLAQCGMLTKQQRLTAVPALMAYGEDPSLDSNTRNWTYQALREITGERYGTNPTDWREWWAERLAAR